MRDRDPSDPEIAFTDSAKWTMYEGDSPVIDYEFDDEGDLIAPKDYALGLAEFDDGVGFATYVHGNHLGTTALHTFDTTGPEPYAHRPVYTAFGERVSGAGALNPDSNAPSRYGYVGAHGYETLNDGASGFDMTYLHVGARYYSPTLGRFLQRDPIGLQGGANVYSYVQSDPLGNSDSLGLKPDPKMQQWNKHFVKKKKKAKSKPLQPEEELEHIKKKFYLRGGGCLLLAPLHWAFGAGVVGAGIFDTLVHPNEPLNPLFGGSYENWHR
jgi:RHS repeat-associated protein